MKYIVTACVLSELFKARQNPSMRAFFERCQIVISFGTCLTIERGLEALAKQNMRKADELRALYERLISGIEIIGNRDREIARVMARILNHPPLLNTWLPN